jgi:hypothetical protein
VVGARRGKEEEVLAHLLVLGIGAEGVRAGGATKRGGRRRSAPSQRRSGGPGMGVLG